MFMYSYGCQRQVYNSLVILNIVKDLIRAMVLRIRYFAIAQYDKRVANGKSIIC